MKPKKIRSGLLMLCSFLSLVFCSFRPQDHPVVPGKEKASAFEQKGDRSFNIKNKPLKNNAAPCDVINWATWSKFTGSNATGTIDEGNGNSVNVSMSSNFDFSSTPGIYNYWLFSSYPTSIPNGTVPKTTWSAGNGGSTSMTFSHTVTNPVLLIASLGQAGQRVTLGFSLPYVVLYDGGEMTYGNRLITGEEGYAIIMFPGDFKSVIISSTTPEDYTNITWGLNQPAFQVNITETASSCGSTTETASGGVSYSWSGGDNPSSATNTFHASGRYIVTVKAAGGCSASVSKQIDVHVAPTLTVKGNLTGCGSVTATAFADNAASYQWDGGDTPNSADNTFRTSGRYTVIVTDAYQCRASLSIDVIVNQLIFPTINITASPSGQICSGVPVTYSASFSNGGDSPELSWLKNSVPVGWSGQTYTATDLVNGDKMECALTSHLSCATPATLISNSIIADVKPTPTITFPQKFVIDGYSSSVQLNPVISGDIASYLWTPAEGLSNPNIPNPIATPGPTTDYTLTVVSATGCQASATARVLVLRDIIIPNTFTPNGDGINDTWEITNLVDFPKATIDIYNRYGTNLYHSVGYTRPWDGLYKGKKLPTGTYYYLINLKDQVHGVQSGWVAILR